MSASAPSVFADAGILCYEDGYLTQGLELLSLRLELAGAGDLLTVLTLTCWGTDRNDCPHCALTKGTPDPHPRPPTPPPPPPPGPKGIGANDVTDPRAGE